MEDIDDDFGELYADLDIQPSSSIKSLRCISESFTEKADINKEDSGSGFQKPDSNLVDATENVSSPDVNADKRVIVDSGSDSEDDLNILLNDDDDSPSFPVTCGAKLRAVGYEEEEENGGGLMEGSCSDKNRKCFDQSQMGEGLVASVNCNGGGERENVGKCGYLSQYKYLRSQSEAFKSNSKGSGCAGTGSNSVLDREQEDNERLKPSSLVAPRKHNFSLPRSRTILDVNIDAFGYKPWRLPEADLTDYFNFGFNEDSWKHYCNKLDQYRHGEYMSPKNLSSDSHKTNEACEFGLEDEILEQKGTAIQVKDSFLERQPSLDVKRPLYRDSDVIQITLQDSNGDSSGSLKGISALIDCSELDISENGDSEHDDRENHGFDSASKDELQVEYLDAYGKGVDQHFAKRSAQEPRASKALGTGSDNYGRAYMSDDGHDHQEAEFDPSNGTKEAKGISNHKLEKVGRMFKTKSLQDENNQYCPSSSSSGHCEEPRDGCYTEKSYIDIKKPSFNTAKLWQSAASDFYHSTDSRSRGAKTREGDCKYFDKQRLGQVYRKNQNRIISGGFVPKIHLDEEEFPPSDTDRHFEKNKRINSSNNSYHKKDFSYYEEVEHPFNRRGHNRFGIEKDKYLGRNLDEEEYFIEERRSRMEDELMARDLYRYERRLDVEEMDPIISNERSSYLNHETGFQRKRKAVDLQFGRTKEDEFFFKDQFRNDFTRERFERSVPYDNLPPEYLEDEFDERFLYDSRIPRRVDGTSRSPSTGFEDLRSMDEDDEHWSFRDIPYRANLNSKRNELYERHTKYKREIWTERSEEIYPDTLDAEESINNRDNNMVCFGRRHFWKSEVLHWTEDGSTSRHPDDTSSFPFQRHLRPKICNVRHGDEEHVEWHRTKLINHGNRWNQLGRKSNVMCKGIREQAPWRCENTIHSQLVSRERKPFWRFNPRRGVFNNAKPESITWNINAEKKTSDKSKECDPNKVPEANIPKLEEPGNAYKKSPSKFPVSKSKEASSIEEGKKSPEEINKSAENKKSRSKFPGRNNKEALDIEEGQKFPEEINKSAENIHPTNNVAEASYLKNCNENPLKGKRGIQEKKNNQILEVIAKMEKRRERFKEPISLNKDLEADSDINPKSPAEPVGERVEMKQQRPARKRRWGGN